MIRTRIEELPDEQQQQQQTKVIAVMNNKGGCGKTTTALALGMYLIRTGNKVLFWDNDPQCNLTQRLGLGDGELIDKRLDSIFRNFETKPGLSHIVEFKGLQRIHKTGRKSGKVGIMAGSRDAEIDANALEEKLRQGKLIGRKRITIFDFFNEHLDFYKRFYDYIVIDTAPALEGNLLNRIAINCTDEIIYPIDGLEAILGVKSILEWMKGEFRSDEKIPNGLFAMVKYQKDTKNIGQVDSAIYLRNSVYRILKHSYGVFVCDKGVLESRKMRSSLPGFGAKTQYTYLCEEIMKKINNGRGKLFSYITDNAELIQAGDLELAILEKKMRKKNPTFKKPIYIPTLRAVRQSLPPTSELVEESTTE